MPAATTCSKKATWRVVLATSQGRRRRRRRRRHGRRGRRRGRRARGHGGRGRGRGAERPQGAAGGRWARWRWRRWRGQAARARGTRRPAPRPSPRWASAACASSPGNRRGRAFGRGALREQLRGALLDPAQEAIQPIAPRTKPFATSIPTRMKANLQVLPLTTGRREEFQARARARKMSGRCRRWSDGAGAATRRGG